MRVLPERGLDAMKTTEGDPEIQRMWAYKNRDEPGLFTYDYSDRYLGLRSVSMRVFPFYWGSPRVMGGKGDYDDREPWPGRAPWDQVQSLPSWAKRMADALWDALPEMEALGFDDSRISVKHRGSEPPLEVAQRVLEVIRPFIAEQASLIHRYWEVGGA